MAEPYNHFEWAKKQAEEKFKDTFGPFRFVEEQEINGKGELYKTQCYLLHFYEVDMIVRMGPFADTFSTRRLGHFNTEQMKDLMNAALRIRGTK